MSHVSAVNYFQQLSQLLLSILITTQEEKALSLDEGTKAAVNILLSVRSSLGKVMLIGNGGSAAIASHVQNDLCKAVGVRALVFNEPPLLTALSNDHGYESAFEWPVGLWADADDVMVAFSSSGRSENILRAVRAAAIRGCKVVTFSGFQPTNPLRQLGDVLRRFPGLRLCRSGPWSAGTLSYRQLLNEDVRGGKCGKLIQSLRDGSW
jgi:D-sedoheptulose 7-phosphate isomerase